MKSNKKMRKVVKVALLCLSIILIIIISAFLYLLINRYKSLDDSGLNSNNEVEVSSLELNGVSYYFFDNIENDSKAFIFYQGGGIDEKAYANLLNKVALLGTDCFLIDMPLDYALFNINAIDVIIDNYDYDSYYIGGHSLGGVCSCLYVENNTNLIEGIILLASYSTKDLTDSNIKVLSIYGSNDGVLNMDKYTEYKDNLPKNYIEKIIDGGNHAGFGSYGSQKGDNQATITALNQQEIAANLINNFING